MCQACLESLGFRDFGIRVLTHDFSRGVLELYRDHGIEHGNYRDYRDSILGYIGIVWGYIGLYSHFGSRHCSSPNSV